MYEWKNWTPNSTNIRLLRWRPLLACWILWSTLTECVCVCVCVCVCRLCPYTHRPVVSHMSTKLDIQRQFYHTVIQLVFLTVINTVGNMDKHIRCQLTCNQGCLLTLERRGLRWLQQVNFLLRLEQIYQAADLHRSLATKHSHRNWVTFQFKDTTETNSS